MASLQCLSQLVPSTKGLRTALDYKSFACAAPLPSSFACHRTRCRTWSALILSRRDIAFRSASARAMSARWPSILE